MSAKWLDLIKALAPTIIGATVPHGNLIAPIVAHGIEVAESLKSKPGEPPVPGSVKLAKAQEIVDIGIAGVNAVKPGAIDPVAVHSTLAEGISTVVDTAKLIHKQSLVLGG